MTHNISYPAILGDYEGRISCGHQMVFVRTKNHGVIQAQNYINIPLVYGMRISVNKDVYGCWEIDSALESHDIPKIQFDNRKYCSYCGSNAKIDERGNCGSCGAPIKQ